MWFKLVMVLISFVFFGFGILLMLLDLVDGCIEMFFVWVICGYFGFCLRSFRIVFMVVNRLFLNVFICLKLK